MQVHISTPYRTDKNLGKAYNETLSSIPDGDAACVLDYDVMLLTPDAGAIISEYAIRFPHNLLTCFTNRVSPLSKKQLLGGTVSNDPDVRNHIKIAEKQRTLLYSASPVNRDISGFLMVIPKSLWKDYPFDESGKCLGVDTYYGRRIREAGRIIYRMNGLYVFHAYRITTHITDKSHLL